ncbi:hypothetical protein NUACC21_80140 [Scytonema sp. NUACC21]
MAQQTIDGELHVTSNLSVGLIDFGQGEGQIVASGKLAGIYLYRRNLTSYPNPHVAGDNFSLYNADGTLRLGSSETGALLGVTANGNVGIGTTTPQAKLQVRNGAIMPEVGRSDTAGILFPRDPGGGYGDKAYIRYFIDGGGEKTKLLIGCENDADDRISFFQFGAERLTINNGNVGIGKGITNFNRPLIVEAAGAAQELISFNEPNGSTKWHINQKFNNKSGLNFVESGVADGRLFLQAGGNVGIGTTTPSEKLDVNGNIKATNITAPSDLRYKEDISLISDALEKVLAMRGVRYQWKQKEFSEKEFGDRPQIGFIGQEIETVCPELVFTDSLGYKALDYSRLTPILVEAIKQQQELINQQKLALEAVQEELATLKATMQNN